MMYLGVSGLYLDDKKNSQEWEKFFIKKLLTNKLKAILQDKQ